MKKKFEIRKVSLFLHVIVAYKRGHTMSYEIGVWWKRNDIHASTRSELRGASCEDWKSALMRHARGPSIYGSLFYDVCPCTCKL